MMMSPAYHTLQSYCLLMMFVDVEKLFLVEFIYKVLHVHHIYN